MDACHIVLGRPWLFDRQVHHDGRANTYEFKKDGQRYKLTPMLENAAEATTDYRGTSMSNSNIMLLCSAKEFLKEEKRAKFCLAIVPKVVKEEVKSENNIATKIKPLLDEFKEIVVDDLLRGLPPMRSISHQIDLIPRASLPNKALRDDPNRE